MFWNVIIYHGHGHILRRIVFTFFNTTSVDRNFMDNDISATVTEKLFGIGVLALYYS